MIHYLQYSFITSKCLDSSEYAAKIAGTFSYLHQYKARYYIKPINSFWYWTQDFVHTKHRHRDK